MRVGDTVIVRLEEETSGGWPARFLGVGGTDAARRLVFQPESDIDPWTIRISASVRDVRVIANPSARLRSQMGRLVRRAAMGRCVARTAAFKQELLERTWAPERLLQTGYDAGRWHRALLACAT